jgi:hypothetical protein
MDASGGKEKAASKLLRLIVSNLQIYLDLLSKE